MKIYCNRNYSNLERYVGKDVWIKVLNEYGFAMWIQILREDGDDYYIKNIADEYVSQKHSWSDVYHYADIFINRVNKSEYIPVIPLDIVTTDELQEMIKDNSNGVPTQIQED